MSIIDLDAIKAAGEIPSDLDRRVMKILGLSEMCNGVPSFPSWRCAQCDLHLLSWDSSSTPHGRVAKPYSKNLVASRDVLAWLYDNGIECSLYRAPVRYLSQLSIRRITIPAQSIISFRNLHDEPLAIAIAVNALFGEKDA